MKKVLYLMRHGETLFNQLHKIQGWCDSPLTPKGIEQAKIAGDYFKENQIVFDDAYCSTLERTSDTLECTTDIPYTRLKGLKEWNFGRFEGEPEFLNPALPYGDFFVPFGGEREVDLRNRVAETIAQLMRTTKGQTILAVSHGASCRHFMRYWSHTSQIDSNKISNCCILKFAYHEDETFELLEIINHDFAHLN
ncbi:histidine phosphatase family protein [Enterococcus saccharolyticus]|uniref:histidine phosphatase family protein n=1 Tax=Enterococcus saccharolyticus TaxID=41997 RepID=UPI0039E0F26B